MALPQVVIVGRPNVGKSSIMNWLAGKLVSVVDPTAGVTRDRVTYLYEYKDGERYFEITDTGGMGIVDLDDLSEDIERQIETAIVEADLILFVVDGTTAVPAPLDQMVAERLRKVTCPKIMVINKCDSTKTEDEGPAFFGLCNGPVVYTSVKANRGKRELLEVIVEQLGDMGNADEVDAIDIVDPELKIAIVGRRNVGKSTFLNALAQEERMIVSEIAGTTRDSVDLRFEQNGKVFTAIDTPGVRKKKSLASDVEFYGLVRAQKSIRRADVILMFFSSIETISQVDAKLVEFIKLQYKPCIFVVNKWDLGKEQEMTSDRWAEYLFMNFSEMRHAPVAFVTAKEEKNVSRVIQLAQAIYKQSMIRVGTGKLNRIVQAAVDKNQPPMRQNRNPKLYYSTQVGIQPPTIVLKVNDPVLYDETWKRYMLSFLRENLPFKEVPMKIYYRPRNEVDPNEDRS
jgi:GTP-binding protein